MHTIGTQVINKRSADTNIPRFDIVNKIMKLVLSNIFHIMINKIPYLVENVLHEVSVSSNTKVINFTKCQCVMI